MNWIIILAVSCAISVVQGLFLGTTLIVKGRMRNNADFFLGLAVIGLALRVGKSLVYYFWLDMSLWGVGLGGAGLYAVGPGLLLYLKYHINNSKSNLNLLHFLPSIFLLFSGGFLDWQQMHLVYIIGTIQLFLYLGICLITCLNAKMNYTEVIFSIILGIALVGVSFVIQLMSNGIEFNAMGGVFASIILYFINYSVIKGNSTRRNRQTTKLNDAKRKILQEVESSVRKAIVEDEFYKEPRLTLNKLAEKINRPTYLVRQAIVQNSDLNFNDYVNGHRIKEVKKVLQESYAHYTIEGMAYNVGFSSMSSFYEAFKKVENCTPVEYKNALSFKKTEAPVI